MDDAAVYGDRIGPAEISRIGAPLDGWMRELYFAEEDGADITGYDDGFAATGDDLPVATLDRVSWSSPHETVLVVDADEPRYAVPLNQGHDEEALDAAEDVLVNGLGYGYDADLETEW